MPLSYDFTLVKLAKIKISRNRQRKKLEKIEELADSINRNELLNPVVVTREYNLVAGERRIAAFKLLKRQEIPIHFLDELSP